MATNPEDIELGKEEKASLARAADRNGKPWREFFRKAIASYEQDTPNGEKQASAALPSGFDEDTEYLELCMEDLREIEADLGSEALTLEAAEGILCNVSGSMLEDVNEDRGDR